MKDLKNISFVLTLVVVVIIIVIFPLGLIYSLETISFADQPGFSNKVALNKDSHIKQEVFIDRGNFSGVGMSIKNPNLKNKKEVILNVYDDKGQLVRTSLLSGYNIPDGSLVNYYFTPIAESQNNWYTIEISSPDTEQYVSLDIFITKKNVSWLGKLYVANDEYKEGKIALKTYFKPSNKLEIVNIVISDIYSRITRDKFFVLSYLFTILLLVYLYKKEK